MVTRSSRYLQETRHFCRWKAFTPISIGLDFNYVCCVFLNAEFNMRTIILMSSPGRNTFLLFSSCRWKLISSLWCLSNGSQSYTKLVVYPCPLWWTAPSGAIESMLPFVWFPMWLTHLSLWHLRFWKTSDVSRKKHQNTMDYLPMIFWSAYQVRKPFAQWRGS